MSSTNLLSPFMVSFCLAKYTSKKILERRATPNAYVRIHKLNEITSGWLNYFRLASMGGRLKELDRWVRNRIRYCIWHHWKKPERKRKNLLRLGVDPCHAYSWSRA